MKLRKAKRLRVAAYLAGPLGGFRTISFLTSDEAMRRNRLKARGEPMPTPVMEIGRVEGFRFITS